MNNYIVGLNTDVGYDAIKYKNKNIFDNALFKHIKKEFESIEKIT